MQFPCYYDSGCPSRIGSPTKGRWTLLEICNWHDASLVTPLRVSCSQCSCHFHLRFLYKAHHPYSIAGKFDSRFPVWPATHHLCLEDDLLPLTREHLFWEYLATDYVHVQVWCRLLFLNVEGPQFISTERYNQPPVGSYYTNVLARRLILFKSINDTP